MQPANWTGTFLHLFRSFRPILIVTALVLVCLSADWAGALVLFNSFSFIFAFRLVSCLTIDCLQATAKLFGLLLFWISLCVVFSGWCFARFGLLWLFFCGLRLVVFSFLFGFCLWCFPLVVFFCSAFGVRGRFCLALSLLRSPLLCPPPRFVLWCLLVQSVLCWSLPLGIWLCLRLFCGRRQSAFAWSPHLEAYLRTSGESNRHR